MIEFYGTDQSVGEIRTHFVDFTNDLPDGVTVSSATATLTGYPSGGTAAVNVGVIASNVAPVTIGTASAAGLYTVDVVATLSDAEKIAARLMVQIFWSSTRATASNLIAQLRTMTDTSVNDYSVGGARYWSDAQLLEIIDRYAEPHDFEWLTPRGQRAGAIYVYKEYNSGVKNWELSPVILDTDAGTIASGYTFDAARGLVTFSANQLGSARYISGTAYNLNEAAADVWLAKMAHYAAAYDVSTDNHKLTRSQLMTQAGQMAAMYASKSGQGVNLERGDCNAAC